MRKTKMINKVLLTQAVNASNQLHSVLNKLIPLLTNKLVGEFIGATTHRASVKIDNEIKVILAEFVPTGVRCRLVYEKNGVYIRVSATVSSPRPGDIDLNHTLRTEYLLCNIDPNTRIASVQNLPVFQPYPTTTKETVVNEFVILTIEEDMLDTLKSHIAAKKRRVNHFISEKSTY